MPDQLLYPDEENSDILKNYIDLQSQLNELLLKQAKNSENLAHISLDLESQINSRLSKQKDILKSNEEELLSLAKIKNQTIGTTDVLSDQAKASIAAAKQRISDNLELVAILGMQNELEISLAKKRFAEENKWFNFASKNGKELFGLKVEEYDMVKSIGEELKKYPFKLQFAAGIIATTLVILKKSYDLFKSFDKAAWDFRKAMGITRNDMKGIRVTAERLAIDFMHIGVTIDGAYNAVKALGKEMGGVHIVSTDLIKTVAILQSQLGVSEETTAGFLRNMAGISKSTMEAQKDTAYIAVNMANAAGVNLGEVMSDISKASGTTLVMMSRLPTVVIRTAIEAKRLGTSLSNISKSSREILNFSENVQDELQAAVLLGRGINLQRARELAYRRNLEGSTKEILRITKQIDFENLDVFQQEAFAKATGKSVDELLRMVVAERQWEAARRDPTLSSRVAAYDKIRASNEATLKSNAKNTELFLMQKSNQERLTAITQKWNQILAKAGEIFLPVIDNLLTGVVILLDMARPLTQILGWITRSWKVSVEVLTTYKNIFSIFRSLGKFTGVLNILFAVWNVVKSVCHGIKDIAEGFGLIGDKGFNAMKILHGIGKLTIGVFAGIVEGFFGFLVDIPILILRGFGALGSETAKIWAETVEKWWTVLKDWFGFSPSKIALLIVKGITSVGSMLFDALTDPFRRGFAWILDKLPGMGKFAEKLRGGIGGMLSEPLENKVINSYVPALQVTPEETKYTVATNKPVVNTTTTNGESGNEPLLQNILSAINTLNKNLEDGKIGFYVDGQLLSATIARQTLFRGGYGVNKV